MDYTFLSENYVWIIVVVAVVIMTIIGYIADKTNFGEKKSKKEPKVKETNNNLNENVQVNQNVELNDDFNNYQNVESFDMPVVEQNTEEMASLEPEMMGTIQPEVIEPVQPEIVETVQSEVVEPVQTEIIEPSQPEVVEPVQTEMSLDDFEMPEEEASNYLQDNIYDQDIAVDEEMNMNFEENNSNSMEQLEIMNNQQPEEFINQESVNTQENTQEIQSVQPQEIDFELPSIDKINEEIAEVEEDEDVWKF